RQERSAGMAAAQRDAPRLAPALSVVGSELLNGPRITFPRGTDGEATVVPRSRLQLQVTAEAPIFHAGRGSAARRARAEAAAADARELAAAALNRLIGRPLGQPLAVAPVEEPGLPPPEPEALAAAEQRPDVRALAAQAAVAEEGAKLARAQAAPSVNLTAGYA